MIVKCFQWNLDYYFLLNERRRSPRPSSIDIAQPILADKKSKERSSSVGGQKKDKKVMELKATMKMYHDELEEAVSELFG